MLVPFYKNKGDITGCGNCRGINLMIHTMKLWERVVEARLMSNLGLCQAGAPHMEYSAYSCYMKSGERGS